MRAATAAPAVQPRASPRRQYVQLPELSSLRDDARPPATPRGAARGSPRQRKQAGSGPPPVGSQTLQALSSLKDPAVHAVIESEAVRQITQSFTREGSEWLSVAVHTEVCGTTLASDASPPISPGLAQVLLQHVLEASSHLPVPNRFRTEAVCALLHTFASTLGRCELLQPSDLRPTSSDLVRSPAHAPRPGTSPCFVSCRPTCTPPSSRECAPDASRTSAPTPLPDEQRGPRQLPLASVPYSLLLLPPRTPSAAR